MLLKVDRRIQPDEGEVVLARVRVVFRVDNHAAMPGASTSVFEAESSRSRFSLTFRAWPEDGPHPSGFLGGARPEPASPAPICGVRKMQFWSLK